MSGVSWLCLAGDEIANGNRALTYARASGNPGLEIALAGRLLPEPDGPVPENLAAFCAAIEDDARTPESVTYVSPSADPAPWYVSSREDSAEFLGVHLTDVRVGSVISRSVTPRFPVGGTLGPLRRAHRVVSFSGTMFASSDRGMRYGERWLNDVLSGADCETGSDAHILLACDPDTERVLPLAGILEPGVIVGSLGERVPDCLLQAVSFQLASPLPWLEHLPEVVATDALDGETPLTALVTGPEWTGDVAVIVDIVTAGGIEDLVISAAFPVADECPTNRPPWAYAAVTLPPNRTLRVDASRQSVTVTETSSGLVVGGMEALDFAGLFRWIEVGACTTVCVSVGGGTFADAEVTISTVAREL